MAYKVSWNGKKGSKFSFPNPSNPEEKIILGPGESMKFDSKPEIGNLPDLEIEDLDVEKPIELPAEMEEDSEEPKEEKKKSKRNKKSPKKGSVGNKRIG